MSTIYKCRKCGTEIEVSVLVFQLQQEIERLREDLKVEHMAIISDVHQRRNLAECRKLLLQYGAHMDNCRSHDPYVAGARKPVCDCGWKEIKEAARAAGGGDGLNRPAANQ